LDLAPPTQAQETLFSQLDALLRCHSDGAEAEREWEHNFGLMVYEIFNENEDTCLLVSAAQIEAIVLRVRDFGIVSAELLSALRAIVKVEAHDVCIERTQNLVVRSLMRHRAQVINIAYVDEKPNAKMDRERIALLETCGEIAADAQMELDYHLQMVHLLSACAEGTNEYIESILQTVFSVAEIMEVGCCRPSLPPLVWRG
jgi:inositol 1,4,5-triphosphate receptor type 1